jgi:hypothetical protein
VVKEGCLFPLAALTTGRDRYGKCVCRGGEHATLRADVSGGTSDAGLPPVRTAGARYRDYTAELLRTGVMIRPGLPNIRRITASLRVIDRWRTG